MRKTRRRSSAAASKKTAATEGFQAKPTTVPPRAPAAARGAPSAAARTSITFYLPERLRNRARTAFRATRADESDQSWSDMLTKALLAEVERREEVHNGGKKFVGSEARLKAGRPVGT